MIKHSVPMLVLCMLLLTRASFGIDISDSRFDAFNEADDLFSQDKYEDASKKYDNIIHEKNNPLIGAALLRKALLYRKSNRADEAISLYKNMQNQYIALKYEFYPFADEFSIAAIAQYEIAATYLEMQNYKNAIEQFEILKDTWSEEKILIDYTYKGLGGAVGVAREIADWEIAKVHYDQNEYDKALESCQQFILKYPDAMLRYYEGGTDLSVDCLLKIQAICIDKLKDKIKLDLELKRACNKSKNELVIAKALNYLGKNSCELGKLNEAIYYYRKVILKFPNVEESFYSDGELVARESFIEIMKIYRKTHRMYDAKKLCDLLIKKYSEGYELYDLAVKEKEKLK